MVAVGIGAGQAGGLADAAGDVVGGAGDKSPSVPAMVTTGRLKASHRRTKREILAVAVVAELFTGGHGRPTGLAGDGSQGGVDVFAKAGVQLDGAAGVDDGSCGLLVVPCPALKGAAGASKAKQAGPARLLEGSRPATWAAASAASAAEAGDDGSHAGLCGGSAAVPAPSTLSPLGGGGEGAG